MRDIRFRGKRIDNGEWAEGDLVRHYENQRRFIACDQLAYTHTECGIGRLVSERYHEVDPATICQFTGLKDKNGVEIYEGDILHAKGNGVAAPSNQEAFFKVVWNEKHACFTFLRENYPPLDEFSIVYDMATNMIFKICEVVGNIHERRPRRCVNQP